MSNYTIKSHTQTIRNGNQGLFLQSENFQIFFNSPNDPNCPLLSLQLLTIAVMISDLLTGCLNDFKFKNFLCFKTAPALNKPKNPPARAALPTLINNFSCRDRGFCSS